MSTQTYAVDRVKASKILNVSTRTLDRYLRRKMLSWKKIRGRVLLSKDELARLKEGESEIAVKTMQTARGGDIGSPQNARSQQGVRSPQNPRAIAAPRSQIKSREDNGQFYKDLYEEAFASLKEKEAKLEQALYRIGQLESQTMSPRYPLQISGGNDVASASAIKFLEQNVSLNEKSLRELHNKLKYEKTNRIIVSIILYGILILQPIFWYLMRNNFSA